MPKKHFKITDFSGGVNAYSDARDILDTQFAQNWNASLDKYGVIRFTGAGVKYTTDHPHVNNNFVHGGGLFSFSTDISANVLDGTDLQKGFERGTVQAYSSTSLTLAASPTYTSSTDHSTNDFYNNMIVHIYEGPGKGQSSLITDYVGSSKVATVTAFGLSDSGGTITAIEGVPADENVAAVAKLRIHAEGSDTYHWSAGLMQNSSFLGSLWPWSAFPLGTENLGFVDFVGRGKNAIDKVVNNKYLKIKDRDGKVLTIFFVNAELPGTADSQKFPTCTNASGTGTDHYDKVTLYQTTSADFPFDWSDNYADWTAGDRIFSNNTYEEYYICNTQDRTATQITTDVATIINAENTGDGVNISAVISFDEDGNRTVITLTADKGAGTFSEGPYCLDVKYYSYGWTEAYFESTESPLQSNLLGQGNLDAELEVFQNFTGGLGQSTASLTKLTCAGHSVNIGEYITIAGAGESPYNATHRVVWIETNAIYIVSESGDSTIPSACTFTTVPTSSSKYIIYNIGASGWDFEDSHQGTSLMSNKSLSSTTTFLKYTSG